MSSPRTTREFGRGTRSSTALVAVALVVLGIGALSAHVRLVTNGGGLAEQTGAAWSLGDERAAPAMRVELDRTIARATARAKHLTAFGPPFADRAVRRAWIVGAEPSICEFVSGIETQQAKQLRSHLRLQLIRV